MVPVLPTDFEAILVKPEDSLGTAFLKTYVRFPILMFQLARYILSPVGGLGDQFGSDLCMIECPTPGEDEETTTTST